MPIANKKMVPSWLPERPQQSRETDNSKFYNSAAWRRLSRNYKDKHPLCSECNRLGKVGPADVADHIVPIISGGAELDSKNLQSLCHHHHNQKSGRESKK
tara:strand:+ start:29520 stop:29819 length:300 start_codon:yes stop_codon:yes gene_type:complete